MYTIQIDHMNLNQIANSGQCFRWKQLDSNSYMIPAFGKELVISQNKDISNYVPIEVVKILKEKKNLDYFKLLKYKIITEGTSINKYLTVDEGIENRILKVIDKCNSMEELINAVKTKRYTYNKISRMLIHILCNFTKEKRESFDIDAETSTKRSNYCCFERI